MSYKKRNLQILESNLGYEFKSKDLLYNALKHPSVTNERNPLCSYEKLEFLGDKVLNLIVAQRLFELFPKDNEGVLSLKLNYLVSGEIIVTVAQKISLGQFIEMSFSEKQTNGSKKKNNLEDCMEALVGAIYLDSDLSITKEVVCKLWGDLILNAARVKKDAKTQLQEWLQGKYRDLPKYILIEKGGFDHEPTFTVKLEATNLPGFEATGNSLKEAHLKVAELAIGHIELNKLSSPH